MSLVEASVAQAREEPDELDVEPDHRDDEPVGEQPRVLLRRTGPDRVVDRVEVDRERVGGERRAEDAEADAERAAAAEAPAVDDTGEEQDELEHGEDRVADDGEEEDPAGLGVDLDEARRVADVHRGEGAEGGEDRHRHDALVALDAVDELAEGADEEALHHRVEHDERDGHLLHEGDREAEPEADDRTPEPEGHAERGVAVGDEPRDARRSDQHDEEAEALHHDVVDGDAAGVGGTRRRAGVHVVQLLGRHRVLGGHAAGDALARSLWVPRVLGRVEAGVPLLLDLLVEAVEDRVL